MMAQLNPADETLWRGQLARKGYATCTNPACRCVLAIIYWYHLTFPGSGCAFYPWRVWWHITGIVQGGSERATLCLVSTVT